MSKTEVSDKIKIYQIIDNNIIRAIGDFHTDKFDEDMFIDEMNKKFKLTPKYIDIDSVELLRRVIKLSLVNARGRFNSKELKQNKLIKQLFENFKLEVI